MEKVNKKWLLPAGIAIAIWIALSMVGANTFLAIALGASVGALVMAIMIAKAKGEDVVEVVEEAVKNVVAPDPDAIKNRVEEQLIRLNEEVRVKMAPESVASFTETVIDLLLEVAPRALAEAPDTEATFTLEKMSTNYLPELLVDFLNLSEEDRVSAEGSILEQLSDLETIIIGAKNTLDSGNLDDFEVSMDFMKARMA